MMMTKTDRVDLSEMEAAIERLREEIQRLQAERDALQLGNLALYRKLTEPVFWSCAHRLALIANPNRQSSRSLCSSRCCSTYRHSWRGSVRLPWSALPREKRFRSD